jgi:hypothetical protein
MPMEQELLVCVFMKMPDCDTEWLVHPKVVDLSIDFLHLKREVWQLRFEICTDFQCGTIKEKSLYENMTVVQFLQRLIEKRPLVFFTCSDLTFDREGRERNPGDWGLVGLDNEGELAITGMLIR